MKVVPSRRVFLGVLAAGAASSGLFAQTPQQNSGAGQTTDGDVILKAMRDELERSKQLRVPGGSRDDIPYFISYVLDDSESVTITAALGAVTSNSRGKYRSPLVEVRVGSPDFDNTGHVYSGLYLGTRFDSEPLPLDDNYLVLREAFWLATDHAFKAAVDSIARKRASLNTAVAQPDRLPDFSKAEVVEYLRAPSVAPLDDAAWSERLARLSAIFAKYPAVLGSGIEFHSNQGTTYLVNSEGTAARYPDHAIWVMVRAEGQATDGMVLRETVTVPADRLGALPAEAEIEKIAITVAQHIDALVKAPVGVPTGENYSGPVLFEPQAGAQLFAQLVGDNSRLTRKPVTDPGRNVNVLVSEYEGRVGSRVLPEFFDVVDDPSQSTYQGRALLGAYPVDFEGVTSRAVTIVEKGKLKGFLSTRQPVKNTPVSNGHARFPGSFGARNAAISNLFVKASETASMMELKARLIQICKDREKPFGILIRKLDFPFSAGNAELQALQSTSTQSGGSARPVSPPVLAYRVYTDGREELVRGLRFSGVSSRSLRDILMASSETAVFNYVNNGAPLARIGVGGYLALTSVIAPGLLFDELELVRGQEQLEKPALVPPPGAVR